MRMLNHSDWRRTVAKWLFVGGLTLAGQMAGVKIVAAQAPPQPAGGYPPSVYQPVGQPPRLGEAPRPGASVPVPTAQPIPTSQPFPTTPQSPRVGAFPMPPVGGVVPTAYNEATGGQPGEHPLLPAVTRARQAMAILQTIPDYSATLIKRERIDGQLLEHEYMFIKVRHQPFSVYMYFLAPAGVKGQECLYVEGVNNGNLLAHPTGIKARLLGTVSLRPDSMIAMQGNRYPITQVGIKRLTERLIEVGTGDMRFGESEVKTLHGAKINGRDCTCYEVIHPTPRKEFLYHIARIFVDTELNLPIRFEAYDWPARAGEEPPLIEEYTYLNVKLNAGFTDLDFDQNNPKYHFK